MRDPAHTIEIDRIILTDLGVTPDRAERLRALVEMELQRLLAQDGWPDGLANSEVGHLDALPVHLAGPHSDSRLASGLAQNITQTLQSMKGE
jgi:hypothetical protein